MLRRSIVALALAAGVGTGTVATASAANAAPAGCNAGALCVYWTPNYTGSVQRVYQDNDDLTGYTNFYNSEGGSAFNNGNQCNVAVYTGTYGTGAGWKLYRGTGWTTIYDNVPHIESNYWCTY